jgi:hypothetical protein
VLQHAVIPALRRLSHRHAPFSRQASLIQRVRCADNRKQNGSAHACVHTGGAVGAQPDIYIQHDGGEIDRYVGQSYFLDWFRQRSLRASQPLGEVRQKCGSVRAAWLRK